MSDMFKLVWVALFIISLTYVYLLCGNNTEDLVDMTTATQIDILTQQIHMLETELNKLKATCKKDKMELAIATNQFVQHKNKLWYPYLVQQETVTDTNSDAGDQGGEWSWCTHVFRYGPNFDRGFASFLATMFQPTTALEIGCGIGLYINYISKFSPTSNEENSLYLGIEPNSMMNAGIFNYGQPYSAMQLAMNIFEVNQSILHSLGQFDLVYSSEVAEHIPNDLLFYDFVDFVINRTAKYLVFGAARPDQGGTGHLRSSMWPREKWEECFEGRGEITHLPKLSEALRAACYNSWDKARNTFVMIKNEYLTELNTTASQMDNMLSGKKNVYDLWPLFQTRAEKMVKNNECGEVSENFTAVNWIHS